VPPPTPTGQARLALGRCEPELGLSQTGRLAELAPLFVGLPDDRCQCPHWGVVLKGKVIYHDVDSADTIEAGEAYFVPPGHTPELPAGTELVEFSPTAELERTLAVALRNVDHAGAGMSSPR
jgi:hypothetical protein